MALSETPAPVAADTLRLQSLTEAEVAAGLALSDAAGWNQTGDDWALFIRHGHAIGLRDDRGRWVATAAALPYGTDRGWISMVLVADAWRHRGLASRLMDAAVAHLRGRGIVPVLDATPAGAAVYGGIGFVPGFEIDRWERRAPPAPVPTAPLAKAAARPGGELHAAGAERIAGAPRSAGAGRVAGSPRPAGVGDRDALVALDRASTGLARDFLLDSFLSRPDTVAWLAADGRGFVVARAGRRATQIGPLAAGSAAQAVALLDAAIAATAWPGRAIFLDLPRAHRQVAAWLERQGFARQRPFVRMSLGAAEPPRVGAGVFVLAGPEFG